MEGPGLHPKPLNQNVQGRALGLYYSRASRGDTQTTVLKAAWLKERSVCSPGS